AVTGKIEKLLPPGTYRCQRRFFSNDFERPKTCLCMFTSVIPNQIHRTEVALVEPTICLFSENSRQPFAIEVDPLVFRTVKSVGQVLQLLRVNFMNSCLDDGLRILELKWRQRPFEMPAVLLANVTRLAY